MTKSKRPDPKASIDATRRMIVLGAPTLAALSAMPAWAQAKGDFHIGAIASLSGPAAAFGRDYMDGLMAYTKVWNARGGLKGRKVAVEIVDDETNQVNAMNLFRRLASDSKNMAIWCAIGTHTALGVKSIASEFKVPVISGGGVDALGKPADPWFFKVAPGTTDLARGVIEGIKKRNVKTLAILNATDAFGQSEVANLKKMAADAGIKIVAAETFALTDTSFTSQLVRIKAANPEFLYNGATAGPAILIYNQYQQLGLKIPMAVSLAAVSAAFFKGIGGPEKAEGILSVIPIGMVAEGAGGELERMYKECAAALGRTPIVFHTIGWDHALITAWACEKSDGTREGIRAALDTAKDVPAINGPFTFTPDNHIGQDVRGLTLAQYKAGKWTRA